MAPALRGVLLPIALQVLNNALRHAAATCVTVHVAHTGESEASAASIAMTIIDDGQGFDPQTAVPGLGLRTMRERAARGRSAAGRRGSRSGDGGRTCVHCLLPLAPTAGS